MIIDQIVEHVDKLILSGLPRAELIDYLKWFRINADFGPAHEDVVRHMDEAFVLKTKTRLPEGWGSE
jgi:hypothetical protein